MLTYIERSCLRNLRTEDTLQQQSPCLGGRKWCLCSLTNTEKVKQNPCSNMLTSEHQETCVMSAQEQIWGLAMKHLWELSGEMRFYTGALRSFTAMISECCEPPHEQTMFWRASQTQRLVDFTRLVIHQHALGEAILELGQSVTIPSPLPQLCTQLIGYTLA